MTDQTKARLEILNMRVDLILKLLVVIVVALLFVFRTAVIDMLADAGVKKLKLPFLEVEIPAADVDAAKAKLNEILSEVTLQKQRNEALEVLVLCAIDGRCSATQKREIAALTGADQGPDPTDLVVQNLQTAVLQTDQIIRTRDLTPAGAISEWAIVVGADKTLESAATEQRRLETNGFDARIVRKGTWLRTYATFPSKALATEAEATIRALMGRDVYVVEFASWCGSLAPVADGPNVCS